MKSGILFVLYIIRYNKNEKLPTLGFIYNTLKVSTYKKKRDFIINPSGLKNSKSVRIYITRERYRIGIINLEPKPLCGERSQIV